MIPAVVTAKWCPEILLRLGDVGHPQRFNALMSSIPNISDRVLTQRLRELADAGMIERDVQGGPPVRVLYQLAPLGRRYLEGLLLLREIGGTLEGLSATEAQAV